MNTSKTAWRLERGDEVLGILTLQSTDQPFWICDFEAFPAFASVRPLFGEKLRLGSSEDGEVDWDAVDALEAEIAQPGFRLVSLFGRETIHDFLINIEDTTARFRY